ncbi:MAG: glutathione S-transferase family protein [Bdellovibrionota bacterium]
MLVLHSYRRCPFAIRVRMTLHEKGIDFRNIEESLKDKSPELIAKHPEAKVPLLIHDDRIIYESDIITQYIEDLFPTPTLLPATPYERAQTRLWTHWCNQQFKPHVDHYKYGEHRSSSEDVQQAPARLRADLTKLEIALADQPFLFGPQLTLADIHIFPFLRQLVKATPYFAPLDDFQACQKWLESIISRPSFKKTMQKQ